MGLKSWLTVGGLILTGIGVWVNKKKKEDERYDKIQKMIRDVDRKEPEKEETTEKIIDDIEKSFRDMGLNDEAGAYAQAKAAMDICDKVAEELGTTTEELAKQGQAELDKLKGLSMDEILKKQEEFDKERERYFKEEWPKKVEEAVQQKNFSKMEQLFDEKYAGGPWHPSPASVFGDARSEGVIDDKIYKAAQKYFDTLWFYSGD